MTEKKRGAPIGSANALKHKDGAKAVNLRLPIPELELFKADAKAKGVYFNEWVLNACLAKLNENYINEFSDYLKQSSIKPKD